MESKPSELWQGKESAFFVAHGGELSMHGWKGEQQYGRRV
jgi:hypothetical protein